MAISAKESPKNHTDQERFAAASSCIATEILTLLFARKRRRSTGPVLYQPPRSRSHRVPDLKVPVYSSSPCAKHSRKVKFLHLRPLNFIFDHLNSCLWMPTKEKFYEYVRNATRGKKCYVIQGSRKMFLTVPAKVFLALFWCRSSVSLQKDDWEIKKEQCAGVWATFLRWYVNDLLKHYFILVKEEQIFVM